ncbi:LOW QUALITY PROTEIN: UDPGT domain-containing protein, partial [Cephalotus follicularis]
SSLLFNYLDTVIDWISDMQGIRLRHLPSFVTNTDQDDIIMNFIKGEVGNIPKASKRVKEMAFPWLEMDINLGIPLWNMQLCTYSNKEQPWHLEWLDSKEPNTVGYVNFESLADITSQQLVEFSWGLANGKHTFLWVIRSDLVIGEFTILPPEFLSENKERGLTASWCPQEKVLSHPTIGGFLTHGLNSTMETLSSGAPMICWTFFTDRQT